MRSEVHRDGRAENVEVVEATAEPMPLIPLSRTSHRPENPDLDVRGYLMYGSDGEAMGRVVEVLLDADQLTEDRGLPLYHTAYAVVSYTTRAGTSQWLLVPMAMIKATNHDERIVMVREPAKLACQEAYTFHSPDELVEEGDQEVYAVWESLSRWDRSGRGPRRLVEERR